MLEMPQKKIMANDCHNLSVKTNSVEQLNDDKRHTLYLNQKTNDNFYQTKEDIAGRQTRTVLFRSNAGNNSDIMGYQKPGTLIQNNDDLLAVATQ